MKDVPPVLVDISKQTVAKPYLILIFTVLDPWLLNLFPRSLSGTAVYLLCVAVLSWFISSFVWQEIQSIVQLCRQHHATRHDNAISAVAQKDK